MQGLMNGYTMWITQPFLSWYLFASLINDNPLQSFLLSWMI